MRILHLDTFSTMNHPSPMIQAGKKQGIKTTAVELLQAGISRRANKAAEAQASSAEAKKYRDDVEAMNQLLEAWNQERDPACNEWNFAMTSIVARKALVINEHLAWMVAKS